METYKLEQLRKIAKDQGYKHVRLTDMDGNNLVAFNSAAVPVEKRIDEMEQRLKSPALKDGYYCFEAKMYLRSGAKADKYYIVKGEPAKEPDITPTKTKKVKKNALSFKEAILLNKKIAKLEADLGSVETERDQWKAKYNSLMEDVEEIMDEEPEEEEPKETGMSENNKTFITESIATLLPVLDRHYDLQAKKLEIEEGKVLAKLAAAGVQIPVNGQTIENANIEEEATPEQPLSENLEDMNEKEFNAWVNGEMSRLATQDPERYAVVAASANSGGNIIDLLNGGDGFGADPGDEGEVEEEEERE